MSKGSGVAFETLLGVAFIVLKLTHVIDWSWWWVLAPLWLPLVVLVAVAAFTIAVARVLK